VKEGGGHIEIACLSTAKSWDTLNNSAWSLQIDGVRRELILAAEM
jgi:hypothetical protein